MAVHNCVSMAITWHQAGHMPLAFVAQAVTTTTACRQTAPHI